MANTKAIKCHLDRRETVMLVLEALGSYRVISALHPEIPISSAFKQAKLTSHSSRAQKLKVKTVQSWRPWGLPYTLDAIHTSWPLLCSHGLVPTVPPVKILVLAGQSPPSNTPVTPTASSESTSKYSSTGAQTYVWRYWSLPFASIISHRSEGYIKCEQYWVQQDILGFMDLSTGDQFTFTRGFLPW